MFEQIRTAEDPRVADYRGVSDPELLRSRNLFIAALTPREPSEPLDTFASRPRAPKLALLVGAEGPGLTAAVESTADDRVRIPIARGIDSLNLAVATGIALEQLTRDTRGRGILAAKKTQE